MSARGTLDQLPLTRASCARASACRRSMTYLAAPLNGGVGAKALRDQGLHDGENILDAVRNLAKQQDLLLARFVKRPRHVIDLPHSRLSKRFEPGPGASRRVRQVDQRGDEELPHQQAKTRTQPPGLSRRSDPTTKTVDRSGASATATGTLTEMAQPESLDLATASRTCSPSRLAVFKTASGGAPLLFTKRVGKLRSEEAILVTGARENLVVAIPDGGDPGRI